MKKLLLITVVALGACKGKGGGGEVDCAAAMAHMTQLQNDGAKEMPEQMRPKFAELMKKVGGALTESCKKNKWSSEVTTCLKNMKSIADGEGCQNKLTKEQKDAADKDVQAAQLPSASEKSDAIKTMTSQRDKMCACKDKACGEGVMKEWGDAEKSSEGARHDDETKKVWEKLDDEMMECQKKLP